MIRALSIAGALLLTTGSATADPASGADDPGADEVAIIAAGEDRYENLLETFEEAVRIARETARDEVDLVEADEIAGIAEEIVAEGDADLAVTLLEEAIALLGDSAKE